jgi:hypothetical protein
MAIMSSSRSPKDAPPKPILREIPEETFHHVQPRCAGGGEVHMETRMPRQPALDLGMFMGSVVVADQVQLQMRGHALVEQTQELEPFLVPVALLAEAIDFAVGRIQRGEQGGRAVAFADRGTKRRSKKAQACKNCFQQSWSRISRLERRTL